MKTEAKVGLFITLSLFFLFGLLTQLSSFDNLFKKSYPIVATITDGSGLKDKAKVKLKGVNIGYVQKVLLKDNNVMARLMIDEGVKIPNDSTIVISQDSLLGGKFLDIKPGKSSKFLKPNSLLSKEEKVSSIGDASTAADNAFKEIALLVKDIRDILDKGGKKDIQSTLANLNEFSKLLASISKDDNKTIHDILSNTDNTIKKFASMSDDISVTAKEFSKLGKGLNKDLPKTINEYSKVAKNINKDLPSIMRRIDSITKYINSVSASLDAKLPKAMDKFVVLEDNLNEVVVDNKDNLSNALTSVDGFFSDGTETMKKVDQYLDSMIKTELHVEMRSDEVYDDGGYSKSHLNLTLKPDPTRYYMLGVSSGPSFKADSSFDRGYAGNKKHESGDFLLSAQYGKRYDDLLFRVGIIEGQGGFGVDYFALNDTLKLSTNLYDFNGVSDIRGDNVNLTTTVRYQFFKHINAYISGNNLLNKNANSISVGLGVSFIDNDLKNILGAAAASSKK
ncbi:virulence factor Mce family protein [hydrothermal vent metagenome]|uniref:Virulence factor Mce family protein n=1 Tax=hydrothermal vent metagenome TaxID=652676 RepID=A0A1W1BT74_9ZZZZ